MPKIRGRPLQGRDSKAVALLAPCADPGAKLRAGPPDARWEGVAVKDYLEGFIEIAFSDGSHVARYVLMDGAVVHACRRLTMHAPAGLFDGLRLREAVGHLVEIAYALVGILTRDGDLDPFFGLLVELVSRDLRTIGFVRAH